MNICGISAYFHDAAAALVCDGQIVAAIQEDRLSRRKGDAAIPVQAFECCLRQGGLSAGDLDAVVFYEKPFQKFYRIVATNLASAPWGLRAFRASLQTWFERKLWIESTLSKELGVDRRRLAFSDHHLSHAAASFLPSGLPSAAFLVIDGVGEWATTTVGRMWRTDSGFTYEVKATVDFPHSLGLLYSAITAFLGFRVNDGEYKVMGLASYGEARYMREFQTLLRSSGDARYTLDLRYFRHDRSTVHGWSPRLVALLGQPRPPGTTLQSGDGTFQRFADIAKSLQVTIESEVLRLAAWARDATGEDTLCVGGGVALNSVANGRLMRSGLFRRVLIHPAAGDAGGALGAALAYGASHGEPGVAGPFSPYLGDVVDGGALLGALEGQGSFRVEECTDPAQFRHAVSMALVDDKIVGWMAGRSEWGPRALGARSILARPDSAAQQARINASVKFREGFRPFAPAVLEEFAHTCFDGCSEEFELEEFMLTTVDTRGAWKERLRAVTHIDGTARPQVVRRRSNPEFYALIDEFRSQTGIPAVLNTSFNLAGEPNVESVHDGVRTFVRSGIEMLAVYPFVVSKVPVTP